MATGKDDVEIEVLLDETLELKKSLRKSDSYSTLPPNTKKKSKPHSKPVMQRNRVHKSTVRPFFCCGSELSLNSIADMKEISVSSTSQNDGETELTDVSFSDLTNKDLFLSDNKGFGNQLVFIENKGAKMKTVKPRKKKVDKVSGRRRFFQFSKNKYTPRSRYPSSPTLSDSSGSEVGCMSTAHHIGCMCTAHHSKSEQTPLQSSVFMNKGQLKVKAPKTPAGTLRMLDRLAASSFDELVFVDDNGERGLPVNEALELADILFSHNRQLGAAASPSSSNQASNLVSTVDESQDDDYEEQQSSQSNKSHIYQQPYLSQAVHTQVDFVHCLVPDLTSITKCTYYWGVMDRYAAEKLLENKPEGTFLLRDSAQEEFLFSVSFRRYGRSLHARIEQWNHRFSFDIHDSGVFSSDSVCGLIEHYKDPSSCMFFEPMLTIPSNRTFPFSLKHMCRPVICNRVSYDGIGYLPLPKSLKDYLQYYHYKHMVRVRRFDPMEKKPPAWVAQKS